MLDDSRDAIRDATLVERALAGDHDAFARLIERHGATARRLAGRFLRDGEDVADVMQEASLAAYLNLRALSDGDRFAGWFCGIVLNHGRLLVRRSRRAPTLPLDEQRDTAAPAPFDDGLLLAEVARSIETLPAAQREAAVLVCFDGLDTKEAATALGISSAALKVRLHRARSTLRARFESARPQPRRVKARSTMVDVEVFDVALRQRTAADGREVTTAVILLKEKDGARVLPIWIGEPEATALAMELQGVQLPRPITYSFATALLEAAGMEVTSATVSRLAGDTYYATVELRRGKETRSLDARPSDAINLALRVGAPLYADEALLEQTGVAARVTSEERAGSAALVERFSERAKRAGEAVPGGGEQADLSDLGLELLDK